MFRSKVQSVSADPVRTIKTYSAQLHSFLASALDELEGLTALPVRFIPGEKIPITFEYEADWATECLVGSQ